MAILGNLWAEHLKNIADAPSRNIVQEKMFMDEEFADVVFEVGGQQFKNDDATKKAKISSVRFPAHRLVLCKSSSSTLAELCRSVGGKTTSPIHISDVSPDVFRHLLFHLYGGKVADDDMKSHAKELLDVADKFGVVDLKLVAEACVVETTVFTIDNLMDLLLYADSKNCALLKEAAIDFMLENMDEVYREISFADAPGALMSDVLAALVRKEKIAMRMYIPHRNMRVNDLRWHALNNGLDVDGSRETLIAAAAAAAAAADDETSIAALEGEEDSDEEAAAAAADDETSILEGEGDSDEEEDSDDE
jgi:hypothetical protein